MLWYCDKCDTLLLNNKKYNHKVLRTEARYVLETADVTYFYHPTSTKLRSRETVWSVLWLAYLNLQPKEPVLPVASFHLLDKHLLISTLILHKNRLLVRQAASWKVVDFGFFFFWWRRARWWWVFLCFRVFFFIVGSPLFFILLSKH